MDYMRSLSFIFNDKNWPVKVLILAVLMLFVITSPIATGYCLKVLRNVSNGDETLPEFDYGNMFIDGLRVGVGILLYMLPFLMIMVISGVILFLGGDSNSGVVAMGGILMGIIIGLLMLFLLMAISPAVMIHATDDHSWGFMFGFNKIFSIIIRNTGSYISIILVAFLINFVLSFVGGFIPIIGTAFASTVGMLASSHLYGQYVRQNGIFMGTMINNYAGNDAYNNNDDRYNY
ncbi:DUF4013 domain-containing protein [bacterium]|nr:DUF4013 domain-containing protein [bacterium]